MILVIDVSIAVKAFVDEPQSHIANRIIDEAEQLIVPAHFLGEVGEVLVRRWRANEVILQQVDVIQVVWRWSFEIVALEQLFGEAFEIATETGASFYDALYVAVADFRDVPLVTADERLLKRIAGTPWAGRAMSLAEWEARSRPLQ